jgi:hypothetical protein
MISRSIYRKFVLLIKHFCMLKRSIFHVQILFLIVSYKVSNSKNIEDINAGKYKTKKPGINSRLLVVRGGLEPPTHEFSVHCSTN